MGRVVIVLGPPASGKSSICRELALRSAKGYVIEVDDIRESMLSGFAFPAPPEPGEWADQFELARRCAVFTARTYADAGADVFIADADIPANLRDHYGSLFTEPSTVTVYAFPGLDAVRERLVQRNRPFDARILEAIGIPAVAEMITSFDASDFTLQLRDPNASLQDNVNAVARRLGAA